jgi:hypothetical protein
MLTENLIKGQLVELKVQEELTRYGFDISIPTYNASIYDLVADTGSELLKIQIKKAIGKPNGRFTFTCTTQNVRSHTRAKHKYTSEEIDYFATVWKDKVYLVPVDETSNEKTLYEDSSFEYLAENVLHMYTRISDEELYNYANTASHNYCSQCGTEISIGSSMCVSCKNLAQRTTTRPTRDELKQLIRTQSFLAIGKLFGVTDNAVRKWCDFEKLPRKSSEIKKYSEEAWQRL